MKIHLAGNNPYPGIILIRLYESWIGERLGKFGGGYLTTYISEYLNRIPLKEINKDAMRIFLAGGISGNLREFWQKVMKVYCASPNSGKEVIEAMNSFLAGDKDKIMRESIYGADFFVGDGDSTLSGINVLESYYYLRKNEDFMPLVRHFGSFLLDSGAYTFMAGSHKGGCDWDAYVSEYADFINRFDVKLFFELDIDSVVGLAEVERLRHKLERMTGKKPIPVWHKNRGKEYFVKMCEEYPYVAIGGIVTKEIPRKVYETAFPWFINTAHKHKAKIHGLGYTTVANLQKYRFDSVDSTAWLYGNRGGYICKFNPRTGLMEQMSKEGCRLKSREGADAVPEGHYEAENMKSTVVPFRNGIMLSVACGLAESRKLSKVLIANHGGDHAIYPDCRSEFIRTMAAAMRFGTYEHVGISAPYTGISKSDIARIGKRLGLDYSTTYSCYKGGEKHCGKCGTCVERKEALRDAGIEDTTEYETE